VPQAAIPLLLGCEQDSLHGTIRARGPLPTRALRLRKRCMSQSNRVPAITILVVEDEYFVREDIVRYLRAAGCAVVEAETGEHAIDICKSGVPVDVVFTDVQLPGSASGFDVATTFRAAVADIPVVYASGNSGNRDRSVAGSLFFSKPYRSSEILTACLRLKNASPLK
jgi:CheY-like chemotaxis protein